MERHKSEDFNKEPIVVPSRSKAERIRRGLHIRITEKHHDKLNDLKRKTGRSNRDIIEKLIEHAEASEQFS